MRKRRVIGNTISFLLVCFILGCLFSLEKIDVDNKEEKTIAAEIHDWKLTLGGSGYDSFDDIYQTADGGYIAALSSGSNSINGIANKSDGYTSYIIKYDKEFNVQWTTCIKGKGYTFVINIVELKDGSFVAAGCSDATDIIGHKNKGYYDALLYKFDKNGKQLWAKGMGGEGEDEAYGITALSDGGYVVCYNIDYKNDSKGILVRYNKNDEEVWRQEIGDSNNDTDSIISSTECSDGSIIVLGQCDGNSLYGQKIKGYRDAVMIKYSANGTRQWAKLLGGNDDDAFFFAEEYSDGSIIVTGITYSTNLPGVENNGDQDNLTARYDKDGNLMWVKSIGGNDEDNIDLLVKTSESTFAVSGGFDSSSVEGHSNKGSSDICMLEYDLNGNILNSYAFGGNGYDDILAIIRGYDNNIILCGDTSSTNLPGITNKGDSDGIIISYKLQELPPVSIDLNKIKIHSVYDENYRNVTFTLPEVYFPFKGYSYVIDKVARTVPDNSVEIEYDAEKIEYKVHRDDTSKYYLHIKALNTSGTVIDTKHVLLDNPVLTAQVNDKRDSIHLEWSLTDKTNKQFRVFQKKPGDTEYQSISMTNFSATKQVRVLNIYPDSKNMPVPGKTKFTTWDGETLTLPNSALLKKWMEEPNKEHAKGYGKGLMEVTPISVDAFNVDPRGTLIDSKGEYKYDVIMYGSWDDCSYHPINAEGYKAIHDFLKSGRGYLGGHDTLWYNWVDEDEAIKEASVGDYRELFNIRFFNEDYGYEVGNDREYGVSFESSTVILKKKGLLTSYPWSLGDIGTKLTVPTTHAWDKLMMGDIWMAFPENTYRGPEVLKPSAPYVNSYLHTWNNTTYTEIGHSNGAATADEQKILANALFYLNQISADTSLDDFSAQDIATPNMPKINSCQILDTGSAIVGFGAVEDNGSEYSYYVES